ncbi:E3 ubiquitin-protein ligase Midline-1-like [Convolutriloba macropyga]|uniref:E3 ubiquitin-protein ligase Midline-1-like n=1 Tax=Convolutriloba macropyga TaxID=536237 RepID=UPI003F51F3DE
MLTEDDKETFGTRPMGEVQASKPINCMVNWDKMKERLFVPGVFKPSYLMNCELSSRMNFKFSADSCSMWVKLSDENRTATHVVPPNAIQKGQHPKEGSLRALECILGDKVISDGRYYWEVVVDDQAQWAVGAAYTSVERNQLFGETGKSWVVRKMPNGVLQARYMGRVEAEIKWNPHVVGVSFNYKKGILGLYDAESHRQLFYFMSSFCEPCVPAFMLGPKCTLSLVCPHEEIARQFDYDSKTIHSYNIDKDYQKQTIYWTPDKTEEFTYEPDRWQLPLQGRNQDGVFAIQRYDSMKY